MFLDDELNYIHECEGLSPQTSFKLMTACLKRIDFTHGVVQLQNSLKRTESSWKLFCKKHKEYDENGFRKTYLHILGDDEEGKRFKNEVKGLMKW